MKIPHVGGHLSDRAMIDDRLLSSEVRSVVCLMLQRFAGKERLYYEVVPVRHPCMYGLFMN